MSDQQNTTPDASTPSPAPAPAPGVDAIMVTLKSLQADNAALAAEVKSRDDKIAEFEREVTTLRATVDGFGKREREGAILGKLRAALPHLGDFEARAALVAAAEDGKVDRYSDSPDEVAAALVDLINSSAPALARPPGQGGGANRAPLQQTPARAFKSLIG